MKKEDLFYLIFVLSILVARLSVFLFPEVDIEVFGVIVHHFWLGAFLAALSLIPSKKYRLAKLYTFAIGLGLVIDQLVFMALGAGKDIQYWSLLSLIGMIVLAIAIFPFREKLANFVK